MLKRVVQELRLLLDTHRRDLNQAHYWRRMIESRLDVAALSTGYAGHEGKVEVTLLMGISGNQLPTPIRGVVLRFTGDTFLFRHVATGRELWLERDEVREITFHLPPDKVMIDDRLCKAIGVVVKH